MQNGSCADALTESEASRQDHSHRLKARKQHDSHICRPKHSMSPVPPCVSRGSKEELDSQQEFQRGDVLPKFVGLGTLCTRERHIAMRAQP